MNTKPDGATDRPADPLQPASSGAGPMLQRDYWAVIDGCRCKPSEVMGIVARQFSELPPPELVVFERCGGPGTLELGDELDITIRMAGAARVRVVHQDVCSLTLATLIGHPEAGRITFGAYRAEDDRVIFHIRSRARASSQGNYLGFLFGGDPMQTSTWTDFVNNVALTCGAGVTSDVRAETRTLEDHEVLPGDEAMDCPTFTARAD